MNKKQAVIFAIVGLLIASSLALAIEAVAARPFHTNVSHRLMQTSWVKYKGTMDDWGTTDVRGQIQTQARTALFNSSDTKQFTTATAMWTTNLSRPIQSVQARENFTYVFYSATLRNVSVSTVNASKGTYFLNGTWNLAEVISTTTIYTNETGAIIKVHRDQDITPSQAYGELKIAEGKFNLTINGIDQLSGSVYRSIVRSWFNPFKIIDDDAATETVSTNDVKAVAKCYGAMPGWGNYDTAMDFNSNYRVDISDISTVAANM
jgi:hypothetical protein